MQRPSIWVIDLRTDTVLSRYEIPPEVVSSGLGFASITIDVISCENETFAYMPDLTFSQVVVYNLVENRSYKVEHNYFHMNPFEGFYDVDGLKFSWDDAIFSIALSERDNEGHRLAYFHPMSRFGIECFFTTHYRILRMMKMFQGPTIISSFPPLRMQKKLPLMLMSSCQQSPPRLIKEFSFYSNSFSEFAISTRILRDEKLATRKSYHGDEFKVGVGLK